ncbi:MAG: ketol-acid reductoisomerase [Armatimonadetes bacterium]|nr:ketol-acid reductoisomerase [Armatimonadota bacterium]
MSIIWRDPELSLKPLGGKTVAVLGFGSQGRAQALNLRDSGIRVIVGARQGGGSWKEAGALGFEVSPYDGAVAGADLIALLVPERAHCDVIRSDINPAAREGAAVVFAHGYTMLYGLKRPRDDLQCLLVAPKAIGQQLRRLYEEGKGAAALIAAEPGDLELAKAYAKALGCGRAAVIESSFREETETDLFGEQAVLCGGISELARAAFDTLVEAGYSPEAAYYECLFEIKLISDMMFEHGIAGMVERISDTAQFGAMTAGPRVIGEQSRRAMRELLSEIQSGEFAKRFTEEQAAKSKNVKEWRHELREELIEKIRRELGE